MEKKRKIIGVTGARSEYDLMYSIYKKLHDRPDVDFSLIITGPHLSEKFGNTYKFIESDGFRIADKIYNLIDSNEKIGRVSSIGHQITQLAQSLTRENPDIILVAGDREEAISVTLTCAYLSIPVAHFFGGDIAKDGNIDNSVRYASSKFAHLHFTTLNEHKQNLLRLGEDEWRIFVVGNPALDRLKEVESVGKSEVLEYFNIEDNHKEYCVLIQHPIISEVANQSELIRITLDSILESEYFCFINYPNSDAGHSDIIEAYNFYTTKYPERFRIFQNLDRFTYINLLRNAEFLIGNSSSGLLEAPSLGLPAINIGTRQRGRTHGDNIIFVNYDKNEILEGIKTVTSNESFRQRVKLKDNPYGDGTSSDKVIGVLLDLELTDNLLYKNITY